MEEEQKKKPIKISLVQLILYIFLSIFIIATFVCVILFIYTIRVEKRVETEHQLIAVENNGSTIFVPKDNFKFKILEDYQEYQDILYEVPPDSYREEKKFDENIFENNNLLAVFFIDLDGSYILKYFGSKSYSIYAPYLIKYSNNKETAKLTFSSGSVNHGFNYYNSSYIYLLPVPKTITNADIQFINIFDMMEDRFPLFLLAVLFGFVSCIVGFLILTKKIKSNNPEKKHFSKKIVLCTILIIILMLGFGYLSVLIFSTAKPIIYLYPTESSEINVELGLPEKVTCSYPKYESGWKVLANPNGDLKEISSNKNLYALYYENNNSYKYRVQNDGFVVKGEDTANFLEEKLSILGLNDREAEEFIVYWLPKLESNKYNYIRFATQEEINKNMPLRITPTPDTLIRIVMTYKKLYYPIIIEEQKLTSPERNGFVAVEWGGSEIK